MHGESLWTEIDERALRGARAALDAGDLIGALLAIESADGAAIEATHQRLDTWADSVRALTADSNPQFQAAALRHVLVDRAGLSGDTEAYYDPLNCCLSSVVERGRGMPIMLAAVWMIVGSRAGVPVSGIGLPGHFVARVGGDDGQLVDPFAGGRPITTGHCRSIVKQLTDGKVDWRDGFLESTRIDDLVARVLRNIQICHQRADSKHAMYRVARLTARLYPDRVMFQLIHAQVAELIEATPMAIALYEEVIRRFPTEQIILLARRRLEQLGEDPPLVH